MLCGATVDARLGRRHKYEQVPTLGIKWMMAQSRGVDDRLESVKLWFRRKLAPRKCTDQRQRDLMLSENETKPTLEQVERTE